MIFVTKDMGMMRVHPWLWWQCVVRVRAEEGAITSLREQMIVEEQINHYKQ